jgi:hypothetical protein
MSYNFTYLGSPFILSTQTSVNITKTITNGDDTGAIYKINRPLPSGLTLNEIDGSITGDTLFRSISLPVTYIIDASFSDTKTSASIILSVGFSPTFIYSGSPYLLKVNTLMFPIIIPTYLINLFEIIYSDISTDVSLNSIGLDLNQATGQISGTPSTILNATTFTIRANHFGVLFDASLNISIEKLPSIEYSNELYKLIQGENVNILPNFVESQTNVIYNIREDCKLPRGLTFNPSTGGISGIPILLTTFRQYNISVTNNIGSVSTILKLNIIKKILAPRVEADNFSSNIFLTNPEIEMRRKAEILNYKRNSSQLTKNQYLSLVAKGNGPQAKRVWGNQSISSTNPNITNLVRDGNTLVCNTNNIIFSPTSSSDVPGSVMNLYYDPNTPLVGYKAPNRQRVNIGFKWPYSK